MNLGKKKHVKSVHDGAHGPGNEENRGTRNSTRIVLEITEFLVHG